MFWSKDNFPEGQSKCKGQVWKKNIQNEKVNLIHWTLSFINCRRIINLSKLSLILFMVMSLKDFLPVLPKLILYNFFPIGNPFLKNELEIFWCYLMNINCEHRNTCFFLIESVYLSYPPKNFVFDHRSILYCACRRFILSSWRCLIIASFSYSKQNSLFKKRKQGGLLFLFLIFFFLCISFLNLVVSLILLLISQESKQFNTMWQTLVYILLHQCQPGIQSWNGILYNWEHRHTCTQKKKCQGCQE